MKFFSECFRIAVLPLLAGTAFLLMAGCADSEKSPATAANSGPDFPRKSDLVEDEDGLFRREGESEPFTGVALKEAASEKAGVTYFASFQEGKRHGPDVSYHENGKLDRIVDYHFGEKVRHREWFANGNPKIDAMMKDGVAFGRHLRWYEDGGTRFIANFIENLQWDGYVYDISEDGEVIWDAQFEDGNYVSGIYPEEFQEKLIAAGRVKIEDALYPVKPSADPKPE